jgi:hypothetical protein
MMKVTNLSNYPRGICGVRIQSGETVEVDPTEEEERILVRDSDFQLETQNQEQQEEEDDE